MSWKLRYNGVTKTFEDWRIREAVRTRTSFDVDEFRFEVTNDLDAEEVFAPDSTVTVLKDDQPWFSGRVDQTPRTASGRYQSSAYVVVGPWWDVRDIIFQSEWKVLTNPLDPSAGFTTQRRSHVILNMDIFGRSIYTTKVQIWTALNYVLVCADDTGRPRPFQLDIANIEIPEFRPWLEEVVDQKCAEVVQRQIRWTPDCVSWFDYSTEPPTLHIKQRSALQVSGIPFGDGSDTVKIDLRPRYDLQVSEVCLKYEQVNVVNGVGYLNILTDAVPFGATGQKRRAICQTISLQGSQVSYSLAEIVCAPIAEADAVWWMEQYAPLSDPTVAGLQITEFTRSTALPRYLVSGNITGWMLARAHATATQEVIEAKANWVVTGDPDGPDKDKVFKTNVEQSIRTELIATNLTTGIYLSSISETPGDPIPLNLAQYIYNATSFLHYDGQIVISGDQCSGTIGIGQSVNISGARAEYGTMRAIVQSVSEEIDTGQTTITVGPPKHLGIDDILSFLLGNRNRARSTPISAMTDGEVFSAAPTDIGKQTALKNSNSDNGKFDSLLIGGKISIDKKDNPGDRDIKLRDLLYCDNGVQKTIRVLASDPF